jgi:hypothetical protein
MKPALVLTLLAAMLTPALAQQVTPPDIDTEPDFIFLQELRLWKALQTHDLVAFQSFLLPDFIEVERTILTRDEIMKNLGICTLSSFHFRNHQLRTLSPDAVVLSYVGSTETTCGESRLSGTYNATTTWVRRDGRWLVQIHTETPTPRP